MRNVLFSLLILVANVAMAANQPRVESPTELDFSLLVPAYLCTQGINHARVVTNVDSGVSYRWTFANGIILSGESTSTVDFTPLFAGYSIINTYVTYQGTTYNQHATLPVFEPPTISREPQSLLVKPGTSITLTISSSDSLAVYDWFEGPVGDTSKLVSPGAAAFKTPALTSSKSYWARVTGRCGTTQSQAATLTVEGPKRRSAGR